MQFFRVLKEVTEKHRDILTIDDKALLERRKKEALAVYEKMKNTVLEREEFSKYRDFKSSKFSHLTITVVKEFFDSLSSNQVNELNSLL